MTGLAGNGRNVYSGYNPLCDTLRAKYADRVRRAADVTSHRDTAPARRQSSPVGTSQRSGGAYRPAVQQSAPRRSADAGQSGGRMGYVAVGGNNARRGYAPGRNVNTAGTANDGYYSGAYQSRGAAGAGSSVRRRSDRYVAPKAKVKKQSFVVSAAHHFKEKMADSNREARRQKAAEIKLTKKPFPKGAAISAVICTVMLLVMLFSYAQVYEMNRTISRQRSAGEALVDEAEKLQVELELKDDIRTIERIATEEIGMVKSDRVDTRYISVSGGERIDVIESPEDQTEGVNMFTTLLSAIGENFEKIRDRIE